MLVSLIIITLLLDYLLIYFTSSNFNQITLFYPMLTLTLIVFLYKKVEIKKYFKIVFLIGLFYDILFSYLFLFNSLIFLLFAKIMKKIDKYIRWNLIVSLVSLIVFIFLYDFILFGLIYITGYQSVTFLNLWYKWYNSLLLNISFYLLLSIIFQNGKLFKLKKIK